MDRRGFLLGMALPAGAVASLQQPAAGGAVALGEYNVTAFGARGDGKTNDTAAVQAAIDQCSRTGGRVVFPPGQYRTGMVRLKSHVAIKLRNQAEWRAIPDVSPQRGHFRVDAFSLVVSLVIVGDAILPLIAVLDAVLVHERDDQELGVFAQPGAGFGVAEHLFHEPLHDVAGHHFAGVLARQDQDAMGRIAHQASQAHLLDCAPLARPGEFARFHARVVLILLQKALQVLFQVWHPDTKAHACIPWPEGKLKRRLRAVPAQPLPASPLVAADRRPPRPDSPALGEVERQRAPLGAPYPEVPVKPVAPRVAQVLMNVDIVSLDRLQHDVPAGKAGVDLDAGRLHLRGRGRQISRLLFSIGTSRCDVTIYITEQGQTENDRQNPFHDVCSVILTVAMVAFAVNAGDDARIA